MARDDDGDFHLDVEQRGDASVVTIRGSAGMTAADTLREALETLAAREVPVIVIDLSGMEFISSLGLGAIINGHLKCRHHNGRIKLVNPRASVRRLLETTRLTKLFAVHPTVEQALAS
jgi:anti-sigma B factor antagonist